jgi:hypothetical protein
MAKNKKEENPQAISNVEESLSRTEHFLEQNYKPLLTVLVIIIVSGRAGLAGQDVHE